MEDFRLSITEHSAELLVYEDEASLSIDYGKTLVHELYQLLILQLALGKLCSCSASLVLQNDGLSDYREKQQGDSESHRKGNPKHRSSNRRDLLFDLRQIQTGPYYPIPLFEIGDVGELFTELPRLVSYLPVVGDIAGPLPFGQLHHLGKDRGALFIAVV